ncbi:MAG: transposase [Candidatus Omnitrophota bacterium]
MEKHRRSIRLKEYNYSRAGAYFVTVCSQDKNNVFWKEIIKGENMVSPVRLNEIGFMVEKWWEKIFKKYEDEIKMDEYVIMPNHIHGIIHIVGANPCIRPLKEDIRPNKSRIKNTYQGIGRYVSWFKRMSTNEYIRHVKDDGWARFEKPLWQRNYYEHIIRDEKDLNRIREYIQNNPLNWTDDRYYVEKGGNNYAQKT